MLSEPVMNDPTNPLISIVIYNYNSSHLKQLFEAIVSQDFLPNFEIVYSDGISDEESWEIALEYASRYPNLVSLSRNKRRSEHKLLFSEKTTKTYVNFMNLIKGKYCIPLNNEDLFVPEYFCKCIQVMEKDPFVFFERVLRAGRRYVEPFPTIHNQPLVSITIHNFNYGRYLRQCLDSVFAQSYENIEICFSDNASTDESWDIALEYADRFPEKMYVVRNRKNFGGDSNFMNCREKVSGKYLLSLCSDDAIAPEFIRKCVEALEAHPTAGYAMVHRSIIDEVGNQHEEPSFYNQSCLIPGHEQAAVYMVAAVNPCMSQVMYNIEATIGKESHGGMASKWYANRIMDFNTCCEFDMVYIKEPLLLHRLHSQNDSFHASENLIEIIAPYVLQHQFAQTASNYNLTNVVSRLPEAIEKLGYLCIRYCVRSLCSGNETSALRYFHLGIAISPAIRADEMLMLLEAYWTSTSAEKQNILDSLAKADNLATRTVSYAPPPGSIPL